jgi:hypothetical protein
VAAGEVNVPEEHRISGGFEALCLALLKSRKGHVLNGHQRVARLTSRLADPDRYSRAFQLVGNIARGILLQRGRGDADVVWAVTAESLIELRVGLLDTLSPQVIALLNDKVAKAEREAAELAVVRKVWDRLGYSRSVKMLATKRRHIETALSTIKDAEAAGLVPQDVLDQLATTAQARLDKLPIA